MTTLSYELSDRNKPTIGLIVLQTDQRIESDMRLLFDETVDILVSRIPSAPTVTTDTLAQMERDLPMAAGLLPPAAIFDVVGYGCTSGTSVIGAPNIAKLIQSNCHSRDVTEPVSALIAACQHLGLKRIGLLSPYVERVSQSLRDTLADAGIETPTFASFDEESEERVVRISPQSTLNAALELDDDSLDAIFLSCTNLNTLPVIGKIEAALNKPVLSSNLVLAWHMAQLANARPADAKFSRLFLS